jgi:hypothetical protein
MIRHDRTGPLDRGIITAEPQGVFVEAAAAFGSMNPEGRASTTRCCQEASGRCAPQGTRADHIIAPPMR